MNLEAPFFSPLDRLTARFLGQQSSDTAPLFLASAALLSRFTRDGHVCLPLGILAGRNSPFPEWPEMPAFAFPDLPAWRKALLENELVGKPGEEKPIVLDNKNRLYLCRYWEYENSLIRHLKEMTRKPATDLSKIPDALQMLDALFGKGNDNLQRKAAEIALEKRLLVISGGPGMGKTWTAVRIIRLLRQLAGQNVALCAPTGKAAARLQSSLRETGPDLLPESAMTLHRLLRPLHDTPYFSHHAENPLPYDTVVVDEASMIDLPLFAKLADAVPEKGRLILLGDRHQLASVESGAALNDICLAAGGPASFLSENVVELQKGMRFREGETIGKLGGFVKAGEAGAALALAKEKGVFHPVPSAAALPEMLSKKLAPWLAAYFSEKGPEGMLDRLDEAKALCALNHSPFGVESLNNAVEKIIRSAGFAPDTEKWYRGLPVMVLENDYLNGLFNGECGVLFPEGGSFQACFRSPQGGIRKLSPLRLARHQKAWCLTVHKSQGSEFGQVILVLPGFDTPVLTRELIYTAVTRAKNGIEIWGDEDIFLKGVQRRILRFSGLAEGLQA